MTLKYKTKTSGFDAGLNCVLSDLSEDAYGDVVGDPAHPMLGWDLTDFLRNPIALWSHDSRAPIGIWKGVVVKDGALRGRLHLAPLGSTKLVDELRALLDAGVIKGISVGFRPVKSEPRANGGGMHYLRQVLCEASLCSVPANPSALLTAKALGVSEQTIAMVFKQTDGQRIREARRAVRKAKLKPSAADRRLAHALEVRAKAMAKITEIDAKIAREHAASPAGQKRQQEAKTLAAYTAHASKHLDPPKVKFEEQKTWRGQKLPGPMWRGRKI
jgi:HK97 family phage prohead protease